MPGQKKTHPENHTPWIQKSPGRPFVAGDPRVPVGSKKGRPRKAKRKLSEEIQDEATKVLLAIMRDPNHRERGWAAMKLLDSGKSPEKKKSDVPEVLRALEHALELVPVEVLREVVARAKQGLQPAGTDLDGMRSEPVPSQS